MILAVNHQRLLNGNNMLKKAIFFVWYFLGFCAVWAQESQDTIQVGLILPFSAKEVYENPKHKNAAVSEACRQYFEGFSLAIDSLSKLKIPVELLVYDTKLDTLTFKRILEKKEVQNCDLIFGPVMMAGNQIICEFANKYKVYHISPLMTLTKSSINDPYLISAYPDLKYYASYILESIKGKGTNNVNLVILTGKGSNDVLLSKQFIALKSKYKEFSIKTLDISKYLEYQNHYKLGAQNHVVIASENEFLVNNTIRYLADSSQFLNIQAWTNRKILEFNAINLAQWQAINLNIVSPFYIDFSDTLVKSFLEQYRERYFTEPSEFAINGFEQAVYFITAYNELHGEMEKIVELKPRSVLNNYFEIKKKGELFSQQNVGLNQLYIEENTIKRKLQNAPKQ